MHTTLNSNSTTRRRVRIPRILLIAILGLIAIAVSLTVSNSQWLRERRLNSLTPLELALAVHDQPNDALTYTYFGSSLLKAGKLDDSEFAFQRATRLDPRSARAYLGLGSVQFRRGDLKSAQSSFEQAIKLDSKNMEAYLGLAQVYYQQGLPAHAAEPLKKLIALDPKHAGTAWYFLGKMYGDSHQSDLALDALQHAVALDPNRAEYWRDLGQLTKHYSRLDEAEQDFGRAIKLRPEDPLSYYWLGQVYVTKGNTATFRGRAEQCFLSAIARDPKMQESYLELGRLYARNDNYALAIPNLRKARELDNSDDQSLYELGRCLIKVGNKQEGEKLIQGAKELEAAKREISFLQKRIIAEGQSRELRLRMARVYRKYDNYRDALSQYNVYQTLGARDEAVAKEMDQYIAELQRQGRIPKVRDPLSH